MLLIKIGAYGRCRGNSILFLGFFQAVHVVCVILILSKSEEVITRLYNRFPLEDADSNVEILFKTILCFLQKENVTIRQIGSKHCVHVLKCEHVYVYIPPFCFKDLSEISHLLIYIILLN